MNHRKGRHRIAATILRKRKRKKRKLKECSKQRILLYSIS
jgi:hypothetical protein